MEANQTDQDTKPASTGASAASKIGIAVASAALLVGAEGCKKSDPTPQKENAKFSTVGDNAQISLNNIESEYNMRSNLASAVSRTRSAVNSLVRDVQGGQTAVGGSLTNVKVNIEGLEAQLDNVSGQSSFGSVKSHVSDLSSKMAAVKGINTTSMDKKSDDFKKVQALQTAVNDWHTAVERDTVMLKQGREAAKVAKTTIQLQVGASALRDLVNNADTLATGSKSLDMTSIRKALEDTKTTLGNAKNDRFYRNVSGDYADAETLVGDTIKTIADRGAIRKYWEREMGKTSSAGKAVAQAALDLINALETDATKELKSSMGVDLASSGNRGGTTREVHYHNSGGSGFFTGYLIGSMMSFNGGGGYYYPAPSYGYSSPDRLHRSSGYGSYNRSYNTHTSVNSGRSGMRSSKGTSTRGKARAASRSAKSGGGKSYSSRSGGRSSGRSFGKSGGGAGRSAGR